jgi:hypothetical protein
MLANIQMRLRNIIRLEFIKAILPIEGLAVVLPRDCSANYSPENAFSSVLALPSVNVLVDEIEGNNFGTSNDVDRSLAICQYDAMWRSECLHNRIGVSRGYTLFFPKFMKAQRVYSPTPLANLQTLSFRLQDPENNLLSTVPDASLLQTVTLGYDISGSCYSNDQSGNYIFLQTTDWFPLWSYSQLDKILIQGLTPNTITGSSSLYDWLQDSGGHTVIGTAYGSYASNVTDGWTEAGYANWIIIQNRMLDPATNYGDLSMNTFTGSVNGDKTMSTALAQYPQTGAGVLNLSRQVQLYLRVITREYDLVSKIRTENV